MNTSAIIILIVAMLIIWGGLALAVVNLVVRGSHEPGPTEVRRDL